MFILDSAQFYEVNLRLLDLAECGELRDSLKAQIATYIALVALKSDIISQYAREVAIQKAIGGEKDTIIAEQGKEIKANWRKIKRQRAVIRLMGGALGVVAIVGATVAIMGNK